MCFMGISTDVPPFDELCDPHLNLFNPRPMASQLLANASSYFPLASIHTNLKMNMHVPNSTIPAIYFVLTTNFYKYINDVPNISHLPSSAGTIC